MIELSYFTYVFRWVRPFSLVRISMSSVKLKVKYQGHKFKKKNVVPGAFQKTHLVSFIFIGRYFVKNEVLIMEVKTRFATDTQRP